MFVLGLVGRVSVSIRHCSIDNGRSREKNSGKAICSRHQRALSRFGARLRILRERSLTIGGGGGGGGSILFQRLEPKNFSPSQVNSPKILAPFKM